MENTGCPQLSQSLATWTRGKDLGKARVCSLEQYSAAVHQCTWSFCIKHSYCIESQLFFTKHYTFMIKMYNVSEEMSLGNPHHTEVLVLRSQHRKDVPPCTHKLLCDALNWVQNNLLRLLGIWCSHLITSY